MGPATGRHRTPNELFHGIQPDATPLRTWGCLAHVQIPEGQRTVFGPKTIMGIFTGYSATSKAYRVYMGKGVWRESRDVAFIESVRGAVKLGVHGTNKDRDLLFSAPQSPGSAFSPDPVTNNEDSDEEELLDFM